MTLKTIFTFLFLFLLSSIQAQEESPYECKRKKDVIIFSTASTSFGIAYYLQSKTNPLTPERISLLDKNSINRFDRIATSYSSLTAKKASDYFFFGTLAAPSLFAFSKKMRKDVFDISLIYGETILFTYGLTVITKNMAHRIRPLAYNPEFSIEDKTDKNARFSFFSGHTSVVSASSFFTAKVFSDYHPNSKWKPWVWTAAATLPAITGYLRVRAGKHFPTDVMTGYAVGALIGYFVPHIHKRKNRNKNVNLSLMPTGGYLSWRF